MLMLVARLEEGEAHGAPSLHPWPSLLGVTSTSSSSLATLRKINEHLAISKIKDQLSAS